MHIVCFLGELMKNIICFWDCLTFNCTIMKTTTRWWYKQSSMINYALCWWHSKHIWTEEFFGTLNIKTKIISGFQWFILYKLLWTLQPNCQYVMTVTFYFAIINFLFIGPSILRIIDICCHNHWVYYKALDSYALCIFGHKKI